MMTLPRFLRVVGPSLFVVLWIASAAMGQTETATVSGLVTDRTAAAVAGAGVRLQSVERGTVTTTSTNDAGIYVFPSVHPGQYQISVQKQGFKQIDLLGLIVNVQDHIEQNFRLEVGSISESVTVEGGVSLINTESAAVSTVVDRRFAENLPMNGRSFQTLIQLTPGTVSTVSSVGSGGQFSINGQRSSSNYWMVDGVSANIGISSIFSGNGMGGALGSFSAQGGTNSLVSVDAMEEFRIQTSTYAPEFGRTPGGQISIVTRSGTNQFHGTAFDYLRNDLFDASNWFANSVGLRKAAERQNDFGGTLSGPILKDRTFFFFSYEGLRLRLPQTSLTTVPCDSSCQVFGNARAMAVSAMQPYLNAYSVPNGQELFTPCTPNVNGCPASGQRSTGTAQFNASHSDPSTLDAYSLRVDHRASNKLTLFGRYNYSPSNLAQRAGGSGFVAFSTNTIRTSSITTQTATGGATWAISSSTSNDMRFNYSRTDSYSNDKLDGFGGAVPLPFSPFPSPFTIQNSLLWFKISSLTNGGLFEGQRERNLQRQINFIDSICTQKGSHSLKIGVDFRRLSPLRGEHAYLQNAFFGTIQRADNGTFSSSAVQSNISATFVFRNLGIYVQDTWRTRPRLTLTYGVRWDVDFVPQSLDGPSLNAVTSFDLNNLSTLALAPAGTPQYKTTYGNFAPRVGIAYQLSQNQRWQTVLRGGFGVFYDLASSEAGNQIGSYYPYGNTVLRFGGTYPLSSAQATPPPITIASLSSGELFAFDPNLKLPYTLQWNFAFEQGLGKEQTLSASYIGSAGRRLLNGGLVASPNPSFGFVGFEANVGTSDYDALQIQFQRRLSHRLQALASYTWAHSIDTGSAGSSFLNSNKAIPSTIPNSNRGPSDFDIRHAFSTGLTVDIPAPKINAFANAILHNWSLQTLILANSAGPDDISDANFFQFNGGVQASARPDLVPGQPLYLYGSAYPGGKAFNPAAFTHVPADPNTGNPIRQGDVSRNFLRGFGATQWDFSVHREFPMHESVKMQFRAEMFNVLNHPNFGQPNGSFGSGGFGKSTQMLGQYLNGGTSGSNLGGGGFSPLYQIGGPRSVQFALKLMF